MAGSRLRYIEIIIKPEKTTLSGISGHSQGYMNQQLFLKLD